METKVSQYLALVIIGEKSTFGAPINFSNEMHTAISVAFSVPSSVQSKMVKNVLIYSLTVDPTERGGTKGLSNRKLE